MTEIDMNKLDRFVIINDKFFTKKFCKTLINLFINNKDKHQRFDQGGKPNYTQLLLDSTDDNGALFKELSQKHLINAVKSYLHFVPECTFWKPGFSFEQFRIIEYCNNGTDQFIDHVDAYSKESSMRFLSLVWFLNDVKEGGETEFLNLQTKIEPITGKLVMFPSTWNFPIKDHVPVSNNKYILTSYLHYG